MGKTHAAKQKVARRCRPGGRVGFGTGAVRKFVPAVRSQTLRENTVSRLTADRYRHAVKLFLTYLNVLQPTTATINTMDDYLASYIEYLWGNGDTAFYATYAVAGAGWFLPSLRGDLPNSKLLLRTWQKLEPPTRTTPFTPFIVLGLAGLALASGLEALAAVLLVGFEGFMRTGELFSLIREDVVFLGGRAVLRIRFPKTGQKAGEHESVVIQKGVAVRILRRVWLRLAPGQKVLDLTPYQARLALTELLSIAELDSFGFGWYSLRRGGATHFFSRSQNMEATLVRGRWAATRTARMYISAAVAELVKLSLQPASMAILRRGASNLV